MLIINLWECELTFFEWPGNVALVTALLSLFCQWSGLIPTPSEERNEGVVNGTRMEVHTVEFNC